MFGIVKAQTRTRKLICFAIESRRIIEFYYHGGFRTVEPFCLGLTLASNADNESLICYQMGGYTEFGAPYGWKLFRASEMSDMVVSTECFRGDRPEYDPENIDMEKIYCCVTPETGVASVPVRKEAYAPRMEREKLCHVKPADTVPVALTHNELMWRFRRTHPMPIPELYTTVFV